MSGREVLTAEQLNTPLTWADLSPSTPDGYRVWLVRVPDVRDPSLLLTREHLAHGPGAERRK
jgi:hypothetical protein